MVLEIDGATSGSGIAAQGAIAARLLFVTYSIEVPKSEDPPPSTPTGLEENDNLWCQEEEDPLLPLVGDNRTRRQSADTLDAIIAEARKLARQYEEVRKKEKRVSAERAAFLASPRLQLIDGAYVILVPPLDKACSVAFEPFHSARDYDYENAFVGRTNASGEVHVVCEQGLERKGAKEGELVLFSRNERWLVHWTIAHEKQNKANFTGALAQTLANVRSLKEKSLAVVPFQEVQVSPKPLGATCGDPRLLLAMLGAGLAAKSSTASSSDRAALVTGRQINDWRYEISPKPGQGDASVPQDYFPPVESQHSYVIVGSEWLSRLWLASRLVEEVSHVRKRFESREAAFVQAASLAKAIEANENFPDLEAEFEDKVRKEYGTSGEYSSKTLTSVRTSHLEFAKKCAKHGVDRREFKLAVDVKLEREVVQSEINRLKESIASRSEYLLEHGNTVLDVEEVMRLRQSLRRSQYANIGIEHPAARPPEVALEYLTKYFDRYRFGTDWSRKQEQKLWEFRYQRELSRPHFGRPSRPSKQGSIVGASTLLVGQAKPVQPVSDLLRNARPPRPSLGMTAEEMCHSSHAFASPDTLLELAEKVHATANTVHNEIRRLLSGMSDKLVAIESRLQVRGSLKQEELVQAVLREVAMVAGHRLATSGPGKDLIRPEQVETYRNAVRVARQLPAAQLDGDKDKTDIFRSTYSVAEQLTIHELLEGAEHVPELDRVVNARVAQWVIESAKPEATATEVRKAIKEYCSDHKIRNSYIFEYRDNNRAWRNVRGLNPGKARFYGGTIEFTVRSPKGAVLKSMGAFGEAVAVYLAVKSFAEEQQHASLDRVLLLGQAMPALYGTVDNAMWAAALLGRGSLPPQAWLKLASPMKFIDGVAKILDAVNTHNKGELANYGTFRYEAAAATMQWAAYVSGLSVALAIGAALATGGFGAVFFWAGIACDITAAGMNLSVVLRNNPSVFAEWEDAAFELFRSEMVDEKMVEGWAPSFLAALGSFRNERLDDPGSKADRWSGSTTYQLDFLRLCTHLVAETVERR